jgi:hypothetical protein
MERGGEMQKRGDGKRGRGLDRVGQPPGVGAGHRGVNNS